MMMISSKLVRLMGRTARPMVRTVPFSLGKYHADPREGDVGTA